MEDENEKSWFETQWSALKIQTSREALRRVEMNIGDKAKSEREKDGIINSVSISSEVRMGKVEKQARLHRFREVEMKE